MATEYASANMKAPANRRAHIGNVRWGIAVLLGVGILCHVFLLGNIEQIPAPPEVIADPDRTDRTDRTDRSDRSDRSDRAAAVS